jgi:uncharacterized protein YkwD
MDKETHPLALNPNFFSKMKNFLFIPIFLLFFDVSFSQSLWKIEDYEKWDHLNFRQNKSFNLPFSISNPDYLLLDAALFYITNEERYKVGIPPIRYHKFLEVAAYNHSLKMATTDFFSHYNSIDASRYDTDDRGKLAGITNPFIAENIAYSYNFLENGITYMQVAALLIKQWMNSPGHKENILSKRGRQMGVGTYYIDNTIYGTQAFQWFYDIIENSNGGTDQLPKQKTITEKKASQN